jgi:hypothetical protein
MRLASRMTPERASTTTRMATPRKSIARTT